MTNDNSDDRLKRNQAGFFKAGQVAMWVWVVLTILPIVFCFACCGIGMVGSAVESPR